QVVLRDVTERRKAEQVIRSSEAKYRTLIENVLDGVYQTTPDGEILTANPALARMLGYESETDLLLLNFEKDLYVNAEERKQYLDLLVKGVRIKNAEFKLRRKDGLVITVLENARVVRNKLGDILYFEGTITDINELKHAQEELQMSEERFRMFIEQSTEAIWCFESPEPMPTDLSEERQIKYLLETDCITECNNTMARMYGFDDAKQIIGTKMKDFLDPTNPANIEYLRMFIRSNYRMINTESHDISKDGRPKYLLNNMIGVVKDGRLLRVWGTQRDITTEKQTAQRLSLNEEKFRTLTEKVASAIFIFKDGKFYYVNPAMEKLSGYSKNQLLSLRLADIVHPDFHYVIEGIEYNKPDRNRSSVHHEIKIINKNGEERWIDIAVESTVFEGKTARFATAVDITERKLGNSIKEITYQIVQVDNKYPDIKDMLAEVHRIIQGIISANNICFALYDKEKDILSFPYFTDEFVKSSPPRKAGKGLIECVIKTRKSLLCTRADCEKLKKQGKIKSRPRCKNWLGAPLIAGRKVIGVIALQDYYNANAFGKTQKKLLETIAEQLAKIISEKKSSADIEYEKEDYKAFIEENPIGQFMTDANGIVIDGNKAFIKLLRYGSLKELLQAKINIFGKVKKKQSAILKILHKTPSIHNYTMKIADASGNPLSAAGILSAVRDQSGELFCIKGLLVSEEKKKKKKRMTDKE
ncbi:MAG: PAS domain S-box protein, partial [Bacteroidetes bacterium]|nr:PAS domain S-box protein [Bacteroidota bacterium]